jgi:hypothetical protein
VAIAVATSVLHASAIVTRRLVPNLIGDPTITKKGPINMGPIEPIA